MAGKLRPWRRRWLPWLIPASRSGHGPRRQRLSLEALEERWVLSPVNYVVTSTADSGLGTLRDAITQIDANNPVYTQEIDFDIAGTGAQTINLLSALPALVNPSSNYIFINGLSQPGSSTTSPLIQLNGASAGAAVDGLDVQSGDPTIQGLIISGFSNDGIYIESGANNTWVLNCWIGTNASGTAAQGNGAAGVLVDANNCQIGQGASTRNVISGNGFAVFDYSGVVVGGTGNLVYGNYIGTNAAGTAAIANDYAGVVVDGSGNGIGNAFAGEGNVISGNIDSGIFVDNSGNLVAGNSIGTNAAGTNAIANGGDGLFLAGDNNTIGGTTPSARNIISGNSGDGIYFYFIGQATGNLIQGNNIGVGVNGAPLGNGGNGIEIPQSNNTVGGTVSGATNNISNNVLDGILIEYSTGSGNLVQGNNITSNTLNGVEISGTYNTIGGSTAAAGNVISLNGQDGVLIDSTGQLNSVLGNAIGTNASGSAAKGNGGNGIEVAGYGNYLGIDASTINGLYRNIVSANAQDGILIDSSATWTYVWGNDVGTNAAGTAALGNSLNGIEVLGSDTSIGDWGAQYRNLVSGNAHDGILLGSSAADNFVQNNFVGTNAAGTAALANSGNGVEVLGYSNAIGGTSTLARNVISGNDQNGILLGGHGYYNLVESNFIGLNAAGTAALANSGNGIEVAQYYDTLGGTTTAARNVISGNFQDGIILDSSSYSVVVQDNFVGTNASGTAGVGNGLNGVEVLGVANTIGGTSSGQRNLVSGNLFDGVLFDSGSTGNTVEGDYIGTNNAGTVALANSANGVEVDEVSNTVGGTTSAARNVISGNFNDGVYLGGGGFGVAVQGNFIGTNSACNAALANGTGVEVGASGATIGGSSVAARNIISGNSGDGVDIDSGVSGTIVQGNFIGTNVGGNSGVANGGYGVNIAGYDTLIGGTLGAAANSIADNITGGVNISAGSGNTMRYNHIVANGPSHVGPGIILAAGANNNIVAPVINTATLSGTTLTVTGSFTAATANMPYVLEFFASPAGDPEGKIYLGKLKVTPAGTGTQSFSFKVSTSAATSTTLITATVTDSSGDTSAFSNGVKS